VIEFRPFERLRRSPFALPLAAMAALVVVVINEASFGESSEALATLAERGAARLEANSLLRSLNKAESGQRGYLLVGRDSYLEPYNAALGEVDHSLRKLHDFYDQEPQTRAALAAIETAARSKLSEMATTLELYKQSNTDRWRELIQTDIGQEKMNEVRAATNALLSQESERIARERAALIQTLKFSRIGLNVMAAAALAALFLFLRKTRALDRAQAEHAQALRIERDQLEGEVSRRTAELTELAQHLQTVREDERTRLARELHDELGALLTAAKLEAARLKRSLGTMTPDVAERLKLLNATVDQGIALKRRIIEDLHPSTLNNLGLVAALEIQAKEFARRAELKVHTDLDPVTLSPAAQITVYRMVQESLTNIAKYARAREVELSLKCADGRVVVRVRDDGVGFDPQALRRSSHGLTGMRYRVAADGGTFTIRSQPGEGTTIEASLPELPTTTTATSSIELAA
jgi:signal transduction histidine kinase